MTFELAGKRVWVAGHNGMVGGALVRRLQRENCDVLTVGRQEVDLRRQGDVEIWMAANRPDAVVVAAARVGGIHANNSFPADFLYDNLAIETNIIHTAQEVEVRKLLFLGSSCIYPREAPQPIPEDALLTGPLEPTNEWYAVAKIAGMKLCEAYRRQHGCDFIAAMPTNLFGPGDNFHPENSHVPAALLRRFHDAKVASQPEVVVWGTGRPRREFLYVDDLADACVFLLKRYSGEQPVNVGTGRDLPISEFAEAIQRTVGYEGRLVYDTSRPDGTPRKLLDTSRLTELGWTAPTPLEKGLKLYYDWFLQNIEGLRQ
ncbi:GDP-L-fucose synthase [Virgifigura deserti]|uniref:GDP-L-fucose synthase n=1 Tax=Virgifigura deserti TaxID=2268457 RepID=UPI003CCC1BDD